MELKTSLTAALFVATSIALGQGAAHAGHHPQAQATKPAHAGGGMNMAACMRDMAAAQKKLDALTAKMNSSQGADRIDATAAVLNELVKEHRNMVKMCQMMMGTHGSKGHSMMGGHSSKSGAKKAPAKHDHPK